MIETNLNIFDCVVLGIMALSCLIAFFRGLVREVLSLAAWIGAGVVAVMYFEPVAEHMQEYFKRPEIAKGAAVVGLYIAALMGFSIVNMVILKTIKRGGDAGVLDNMLGLVFGAVRGAFIVALGFFLITTVVPKDDYPEWITESKTHPYAERAALLLTRLAPESLSRISSLQKKAVEGAKERMRQAEEENGYSEKTTRELDRMIESTDNP